MKKLLIFVIVFALLVPLAGCEQIVNAEISKVSEIAAGSSHSLAVKGDGSLWAWGDNYFGQLGNGKSERSESSSTPIKIMDDVIGVAVGESYSMAIKTDGSLWAWGDNYYGQLGNGRSGKNEYNSTPIKIMDDVVLVVAGDRHTMAIKTDKSLWVWGRNDYGQLGNGTSGREDFSSTPIKIMDDCVSAAAGGSHSMALKSDGSLWTWGWNYAGQLGNGKTGNTEPINEPKKIMGSVSAISAGDYRSLAIKTDGSLWAWGANGNEDFDDGPAMIMQSNTPEKLLDDVVFADAGYGHNMAIKTDGSLWAWGNNYFGQLGNDGKEDITTPIKIIDGVTAVSTGRLHSLAIKADGSLWAWGSNSNGQLGNGDDEEITSPQKVMDGVTSISTSALHSTVIKDDGSLWTWGENSYGQLGNGEGGIDDFQTIPQKIMDDVVAVDAGRSHCLAVKDDGSLWAWGRNQYGQLGNGISGEEEFCSTPIQIMDGVVAVAAGEEHSMAIKSDGSLWTWGWNYQGQLGNGKDGADAGSTVPQKIMDDVLVIDTSFSHCMAIKTDGSLWTWGWNYSGQLGNGKSEEVAGKPEKIMDGVVAIAAGSTHSMAIKEDGSLWTWGDNLGGQLGNGTSGHGTDILVPEKIMDDCVAIAANSSNSMAIKKDGSLWVWGWNYAGQLFDDDSLEIPVPMQLTEDCTAVALGMHHSMITKTDGSLWTWGDNQYGQLGLANARNNRIPAFIMNLSVS